MQVGRSNRHAFRSGTRNAKHDKSRSQYRTWKDITPPPHTLNRSFIVSISKAAFTVMQRYASSQWIKSIITTQGIVFSLSRSLPFCVPHVSHVSHVSIPKGGNAYDARSRLSRMISISLFRLHPFLSLSISSLLSFSIIFRLVLPFRCLYLGFAIEMV